jgi:hypothetical protein
LLFVNWILQEFLVDGWDWQGAVIHFVLHPQHDQLRVQAQERRNFFFQAEVSNGLREALCLVLRLYPGLLVKSSHQNFTSEVEVAIHS